MATMNWPIAVATLSVGMIATATLDLWAWLLKRAFGVPITNWGHVGRWFLGMRSGTYRRQSIAASPAAAFERTVGWSAHYLVGVTYAVAYLVALSALSRAPSVHSAALFGILTVLAPWLILQPGLGLGFFASRTPKPNLTRVLNILAHLVFGLGLYLGWRLVALIN